MPYQHVIADLPQLLLDLLPVFFGHLLLLFAPLGLLLDAGDDAPRGTTRADHVLVGHRQQVPLLVAELDAQLGHVLHGRRHVVVAFRLLRQLQRTKNKRTGKILEEKRRNAKLRVIFSI